MRPVGSLLAILSLAVALAPVAGAGHADVRCTPTTEIHEYVQASALAVGAWTPPPDSEHVGSGVAWFMAFDGCAPAAADDPLGSLADDGDLEIGVSGGAFPAGTSSCLLAPQVPHHAYGPGAEYWAEDLARVDVAYWAGADGPAHDPEDPCASDGVLSGDPVADPYDCGAGDWGVWTQRAWTPAVLRENVPGNGACDPHDGTVWVALHTGAFVDPATGWVLVSTPTSGHVWSG